MEGVVPMGYCKYCGEKIGGILEDVGERTCDICGKRGCARCMRLYYTRAGSTGMSGDGWGCCTQECYQKYWTQRIAYYPNEIVSLPASGLHGPEYYRAYIIAITYTPGCSAEKIAIISNYLDQPLGQGITVMFEGYKALDFNKITGGLKICRSDPMYEGRVKFWVDDLAQNYMQELKRFEQPTGKVDMAGVTIALAMPREQTEMKLHTCPSCGAGMDRIAVRGQTVRCSFCESTFSIG